MWLLLADAVDDEGLCHIWPSEKLIGHRVVTLFKLPVRARRVAQAEGQVGGPVKAHLLDRHLRPAKSHVAPDCAPLLGELGQIYIVHNRGGCLAAAPPPLHKRRDVCTSHDRLLQWSGEAEWDEAVRSVRRNNGEAWI